MAIDITPLEESGTFTSNVTEDEIEQIAAKHGVDKGWLRSTIPWHGGAIEGDDEANVVSSALGFLGESVGLNLPQLAYKKTQEPAERAALDDMASLISDRRPGARVVADVATGLVAPTKLAAGVTTKLGGGLLAKLATGAVAPAALVGLGTSKEGEELTDAAIGAGVGLALGGTLTGAGKLAKAVSDYAPKLTPDGVTAQRALEEFGDTQLNSILEKARAPLTKAEDLELSALKKVLAGTPQDITETEKLAMRAISGASKDEDLNLLMDARLSKLIKNVYSSAFSRSAKADPAELVVDLAKKVEAEGDEYLKGMYNTSRDVEIERSLLDGGKRLKDKSMNPFLSFMGGRGRTVDIDRKNGTDLTAKIDNLSTSQDMFETFSNDIKTLNRKIEQQAKRVGITGEEIKRHLDGKAKIERGLPLLNEEIGLLKLDRDPAKKQIIEAYQELMKKSKDLVEMSTDLKIRDYGSNYVHSTMKKSDELIDAFGKKLSEVGLIPGQLIDKVGFKALENSPQGKELIKGVSIMSGGKGIKNSGQFNTFINRILNPTDEFTRNYSEASALFRRTGEVPDFLIVNDAFRAADHWTSSVGQHAFKGRALDDLRRIGQLLKVRGQKGDAQWVRRLVQDNSGIVRPSIMSKLFSETRALKSKLNLRKKIESATNPLAKEYYKARYHAGDAGRAILGAFHANILGTSIRAIVNNALQPLSLTVPELGTDYGLQLLAKSMRPPTYRSRIQNPYYAAAKGKKVGDLIEGGNRLFSEDISHAKGFASDKDIPWSSIEFREGLGGLKDSVARKVFRTRPDVGVEKSKVVEGLTRVSDVLNLGSSMYSSAESMNRRSIGLIGETLGQEIIEGSPQALTYTNKFMDPGTKEAVSKLIKEVGSLSGDAKELAEDKLRNTVAKYLISKTAFNYNKASASEFARTLGPILTQFTKWPVEVWGDVASTWTNKELQTNERFKATMGKYLFPALVLWGAHQGMRAAGAEDNEVYQKIAGRGALGMAGSAPITSLGGALTGSMFSPPVVASAVDSAKGLVSRPENALEEISKPWKQMIPGMWLYDVTSDFTD